METQTLRFWLALNMVEGIGPAAFCSLVKHCGGPEQVFAAPAGQLQGIPGIGPKTAARICDFRDWARVDRELECARKTGSRIISSLDPDYPRLLREIYGYPPLLYVKGDLGRTELAIAVVGSRHASTYGIYSTEKICRELALSGVTIVSGMARGIDGAAHRGALAGKGKTIAVLGSGLDVIYPPEHSGLFEAITRSGAVITEFPFGTAPSGINFPLRNRIISGLAHGVVIVEASDKSGSLITARLALEQGREVFAVPGSIDSPGSRGTNKLIKQGAKLVENIFDILDEIAPQLERRSVPVEEPAGELTEAPGLTDRERAVYGVLSKEPVQVETILDRTGLKAAEVLELLLAMELRGLVDQLPGKNFIIKG